LVSLFCVFGITAPIICSITSFIHCVFELWRYKQFYQTVPAPQLSKDTAASQNMAATNKCTFHIPTNYSVRLHKVLRKYKISGCSHQNYNPNKCWTYLFKICKT
jgi:hypothetical protein